MRRLLLLLLILLRGLELLLTVEHPSLLDGQFLFPSRRQGHTGLRITYCGRRTAMYGLVVHPHDTRTGLLLLLLSVTGQILSVIGWRTVTGHGGYLLERHE